MTEENIENVENTNPETDVEGGNTEESKQESRVIDERQYNYSMPQEKAPTAVGKGGDPFFKRIYAPKEQIQELLDETVTVQDWIQRETCNNVALACLANENLREIYFEIKDGFGEYGPIILMGFKNPQGVEIPRLKILDNNGDVIQVLSGPLAIEEINKRALAYKSSKQNYEVIGDMVEEEAEENSIEIQDY